MDILGMTLPEIFALLFIGMGPLRITMNYIPIAYNLPHAMRRTLAWRIVLAGFIIALVVIIVGRGVVQSFHLSLAILVMAAGLTYVVLAFPMLMTEPNDISPRQQVKDPLLLAISPLAVPAMITPLGVATLLGVSAFATSLTAILVFIALMIVMLALNFGAMLLSMHIAPYITRPILEVFQKIFGFILLAFGIRLVLVALADMGVIVIRGL